MYISITRGSILQYYKWRQLQQKQNLRIEFKEFDSDIAWCIFSNCVRVYLNIS